MLFHGLDKDGDGDLVEFPQQSMEYSGDNLWDEEETITRCVNIIAQMRLRLFS